MCEKLSANLITTATAVDLTAPLKRDCPCVCDRIPLARCILVLHCAFLLQGWGNPSAPGLPHAPACVLL